MAWLEYLLPLIFLFPLAAMAVSVVALRNLHDARVSSPFDAHPLRGPGQALRDRLDHAFAGLFLDGALGPIVVLAPMVYGMGRMLFADRQNWLEWSLYGGLSTALVLICCLRLISDFQRIRRLKLGLACELAVGQELQRLIRPETHPFFIFHDIPADTYTIDHVAVTPHGVFVVETRARTQPLNARGVPQTQVAVEGTRLRFPGWSERQPLRKTCQAAAWLRHWLSRECDTEVPVAGILALPGWDIDTSDAPADIQVVDGDRLATLITETRLAPLPDELHERINQALMRRGTHLLPAHLAGPSL